MDETSTFAAQWRTWTPEPVIAARLVIACVLGGLIGFERELRHHDAGLRTHMLTALAACVFTLTAWELFRHVRVVDESSNADPVRVIEAVTAGAGFLAAGIVFQAGGRVHGLTTGAGVWAAAAIGVACGSGAYSIAAMATGLVLLVLFGLRVVERRLGLRDEGKDAGGTDGANR
jgi:putative Mg2+ transporter-C (MgtC) family protein